MRGNMKECGYKTISLNEICESKHSALNRNRYRKTNLTPNYFTSFFKKYIYLNKWNSWRWYVHRKRIKKIIATRTIRNAVEKLTESSPSRLLACSLLGNINDLKCVFSSLMMSKVLEKSCSIVYVFIWNTSWMFTLMLCTRKIQWGWQFASPARKILLRFTWRYHIWVKFIFGRPNRK